MPKMLRPYFLHHRRLLGKLSQAAFETVRELMAQALGDDSDVRPGMVSVLQTATDFLDCSPHVHALVSRGAWDRSGRWRPVPYVDTKAAELLYRDKVLALLDQEDLISEERKELLLSWKNTGRPARDSPCTTP